MGKVTAILCTGPFYVLSHLYAGDNTGRVIFGFYRVSYFDLNYINKKTEIP